MLITQSGFGGAQKNVFDLATNLDKEKFEAAVAVGPDGGYELGRQLDEHGVTNFQLKYLRRQISPLNDLAALFEIFSLIRKWRPQILHLHSSKAGFIGAIAGKAAGVKVVYTVHGAVFEAEFKSPTKRLFLALEKLSAALKDRIICVSEKDRRLWLKNSAAPAKKLTTIYNGLDWQVLQKNLLARQKALEIFARENLSLAQTLRVTANPKIIVTIANFYPEKGLVYLVEALNLVFEKYPKVIFIHLGSGGSPPEKTIFEATIKKYGLQDKIFSMGAPEQFPEKLPAAAYLAAFDIFVLSSVKEGFPYAILEAMAAGLPIVATRVGGIPEIIESGKNGFLVEPRNSAGLAEKILELLRNPGICRAFHQNSQTKISDFSLEKMVQQTQALYCSL